MIFERKKSAARALTALARPGDPVWTPRDYASLARAGYQRNVIAYRSIRLVAEAAASAPLRVVEAGRVMSAHPLLDLLACPNPDHSRQTLLETLYGHLETSGNAYLEAVRLDGRVRELYALRPDRMKAIAGADGWAAGYEYSVDGVGRATRARRTGFPRSSI